MKMVGFGFTETNTQFAYCTSLHIPQFLPEAAGGFFNLILHSQLHRRKAIWCTVEGGNDSRPNV